MGNGFLTKYFKIRYESWGSLILDLRNDRIWAFDTLSTTKLIEYLLDHKFVNLPFEVLDFFSESNNLNPFRYKGKYFVGEFPGLSNFDLSSPISISWELTNKCNSNCIYCCTNANSNKFEKVSLETIFKIIDTLKNWNILRTIIGGGEPFLRKDILEILEYANHEGIKPVVATNAILIDKFDIDIIRNNVSNLQISLDTLDEKKYFQVRGSNSLSRVLSNLKLILKENVNVRVVTVLTRFNEDEIDKIGEFLANEGVKQWFIFYLLPSGRGATDYEKMKPLKWEQTKNKLKNIYDNFPTMSTNIWGIEENDNIATYISPEGQFSLFDYSTNIRTNYEVENGDFKELDSFWHQIEKKIKYDTLLNFISNERIP